MRSEDFPTFLSILDNVDCSDSSTGLNIYLKSIPVNQKRIALCLFLVFHHQIIYPTTGAEHVVLLFNQLCVHLFVCCFLAC